MSDLKVLRAADYPRMPWKNGGGSTEEITRDAGIGLEGFGWRLSIADIAESGGFSTFAGYERVISVLQGDGMSLSVDGQVTRPLHPLDPFAFNGESHVYCTLLGGPIRDFNLIYAPQRYRARVQWMGGQQRFFSEAGTVLVFSAAPGLAIKIGESTVDLGLYDCLQLSGNTELLDISTHGQCCVIELTAH
ncbi:HutD/Ves family protein [Pseudomonas fluorescens]|uniref:HutD family protein n=1 Tax=Pseudomonas fluorescens TaxID=294 RepID=A0A944DHP1_PSEFL|nr:HutD family protein [Pseudomonas fluorescens]MBT2297186.1 HutD family protein [Pseudomonas fluorescens]MBT2306386.1 HutD family protein [Pseudomonas fluorescens]MBT2310788.1 HutD family protein [Pseudomonas fluorescens]MBT2318912.1 HutD family protein [Pseudomonas fluorescens]MBT2328664.1 HutD family protein [Pseudomonas fluorescens]